MLECFGGAIKSFQRGMTKYYVRIIPGAFYVEGWDEF